MPLRTKRKPLSRRRRRGAAILFILGGLVLMVLPSFLGDSAVATGFRMLATVAWLMLVAGASLLLFPQDGPVLRASTSTAAQRARLSPSRPVPLHPQPIHARLREGAPLQRPSSDPLQK